MPKSPGGTERRTVGRGRRERGWAEAKGGRAASPGGGEGSSGGAGAAVRALGLEGEAGHSLIPCTGMQATRGDGARATGLSSAARTRGPQPRAKLARSHRPIAPGPNTLARRVQIRSLEVSLAQEADPAAPRPAQLDCPPSPPLAPSSRTPRETLSVRASALCSPRLPRTLIDADVRRSSDCVRSLSNALAPLHRIVHGSLAQPAALLVL